MSGDIDALQTRLEAHFEVLSKTRRAQSLPVFALEHGLDAEELSKLATLLRGKLVTGGYLSKHWLVWIVFATEQGYDYDGDEYWYTFKRRMPLWDHGWRPLIRSWFRKFHDTYGGIRPVGRWADFFSIIAWPITHALLPKDLQWQLARTLYSLRYNLVQRLDEPVSELGRYVARMTYGGSSRYENFLEQEELVGSIVLALLGGRKLDGDTGILSSTLERIVRDLEQARSARQWLNDTKKAIEVAKLKGTMRGVGGISAGRPEAQPYDRRPAIRPSLLLRRTGPEEWTPFLEIPCFQEVADLTPDLGGFLRATRCAVAGSPGWRPAGWLLTGAQRRVLASWPAAGKPVLSFQATNSAMDHLLSSEACITPGPNWLFRVGSDGQAIEVLGRLVRPGQTYVIVSRSEPPALSMATATTVRCPGVSAIKFQLPATLSEPQIIELKKAELSVAETIRVWPVGLASRGWDGEGATEWLENECPCFAIQHDHPVVAYELRLGAGASVTVPAKPPGVPTFVKLQPLPAGNHALSVSVARTSSEGATRPVEGMISLAVRPPSPWVSGTIGHTGLVVSCEPPAPTLDEFWEGLTDLNVMGPPGRQVMVSIELLDGTGSRIASEQIAHLTLPLREESWRHGFSTFARLEKEPWNYLRAASGRIVVDGEELGVVHIPLQRDASPVRWVWHRTNRSTRLRLVDDHDAETPLALAFYPFSRPLELLRIEPGDASEGIVPDASGGLFVAAYGDRSESLVVSAQKVDGGLHGLIVEPTFDKLHRKPEEAIRLIKAIRAWSAARLTGTLAAERRNVVANRLKERLYHVMCGSNWAGAEVNLRLEKCSSFEVAVDGLLRCFGDKRTFGLILARDARKYANMPSHVRQREFASLARRYNVSPGAVSKPALDLGDTINGQLDLSDAELLSIVEQLWEHPALAAGARMIQLLGHRKTPFRLPGDVAGSS